MPSVTLEIDERGIGLLAVDRPDVRNALNWEAMDEFARAVEQAHACEKLRVLIVTGKGNAFISGGDLKELQHYDTLEDGERLGRVMGDALSRLETVACPTIAALNGPARGGGAEVALACDMRVMADNADIGLVHISLGIPPAWGGAQRLLRAVGYTRAFELIATGHVLTAAEAYAMGLINRVAPPGRAIEAAHDMAARFVHYAAETVTAVKRILRAGITHTPQEAAQMERRELPSLWASDAHRTAVERYLNRKK